MREVAVLGAGMHRFGRWGEKTEYEMGLEAIEKAIDDAGLTWTDIQAAACGKVFAGGVAGNQIWALGGANGIPIVNVENACATAGSAFRLAYQWVAGGFYDICLAVGIDKMPRHFITVQSDKEDFDFWRWRLVGSSNPNYWAMDCNRYMDKYDLTVDHLVKICIKNKKNGSLNPHAWYQKAVTAEEVLASPMVTTPLRQFMICTPDEGAAAAVLCSKEFAKKKSERPLVEVSTVQLASRVFGAPAADSVDLSYFPLEGIDAVTTVAAKRAYEEAGLGPEDLDVVELQDASAWNEIEYMEALMLCPEGEASRLIDEGATEIGGRLPINPSGGLLSKGEPPGASQLGQIHEMVLQLRGEAGPRQVENAKVGLCHVYGGFGNSSVIILKR